MPTRLALRVVNDNCNPVPGATVDIWHCSPGGLYSGSDSIPFCNADAPLALASRWFRGVQTCDDDGRISFDTCFPGWYSSRTIHIHFTVRVGDGEYVTSQLFFDDALSDEIINTQSPYSVRGQRDTTNQNDAIIDAGSADDYIMQSAKMEDGTLLAWKTLVIRSSRSSSLCSASGVGGGR